MDTVIDILEALESDNSRLYKEDLLRKHRSNDLLRRVFIAAGDPYINYYVSKFKMPKPGAGSQRSFDDDTVVEDFLDFISGDLSTRKVTGNLAKELVIKRFASMDDERLQKWCLRILLRNLRVGVMDTTVNKVWPGSIKKFSVQLAETLSTEYEAGKIRLVDEVAYPVRVEPKLDGLRCVAIKKDGVVTLYTRNGTVLETLPKIKKTLEMSAWDGWVLDGEVLGADWNESASVVMSRVSGKDDSNMVYHVFDAVLVSDWEGQVSNTKLTQRIENVRTLIEGLANNSAVKQVKGILANDEAELLSYYSSCMDEGYEGIMVKNTEEPYVFKRSDSVLKMKPVTTYEGVVVGSYEGKRGGKREGLWGGFHVLMSNGVTTRVAGGFTDKLKAEIGLDPGLWIGRIVEVEGQPDPLTDDGLTRDGRVRFPVYIRERDRSDVDPKVLEAYEKHTSS